LIAGCETSILLLWIKLGTVIEIAVGKPDLSNGSVFYNVASGHKYAVAYMEGRTDLLIAPTSLTTAAMQQP
jgi:hypothetical protein